MDRDFGHSDMPMNRGFGDSFGGMGERYSDVDSHNTTLKFYVLYHVFILSASICLFSPKVEVLEEAWVVAWGLWGLD